MTFLQRCDATSESSFRSISKLIISSYDRQLYLYFYHRDNCNVLLNLPLSILSYCDKTTQYTTTHSLAPLILQFKTSLDRARNFLFVTKLYHKHKNVTFPSSRMTQTTPDSPSPTSRGVMNIRTAHIPSRNKHSITRPS